MMNAQIRSLPSLRRAAALLTAALAFAGLSVGAFAAPAPKNKLPVATLTAPTTGASFTAPATVQLAATATDTDGTIAKVDFFRGSTLIASVAAAPYTYTWTNVAAGSYSITAKATDNKGATGTSAAANITVTAVSNTPPTVTLTSPVNGASYGAPAAIPLAATAADANGSIAKVEFFRGGTTLIGTATSAPWTFNWTNVALGTYSITAKATDNGGASTTSSAASVTVVNASTLSTITSPTPASTFDWPITDVSGTFSGTPETTIIVKNAAGNTVLGTVTGANTFTAKNVPLLPGSNTITATAVRRDGTSSTGSVTVDHPVRLVVLTAPTKGASYEMPPSLTFQASTALSSGTVQRVDYFRTFIGKLGTATTPPYTFTLNNPAKGTYNVYAWMVDDKGVGRQSQEISFTVVGPNAPPTVSLTAPATNLVRGAPASFFLQASAADSDGSVSRVEFLRDGQLLGSTNIVPYAHVVNNLAAGNYLFAARAVDNEGATTTSAPVSVLVYAPPEVSLTTSAASGKVAAGGSVTLNATAASNGPNPLAKVEFYAGATLVGTAMSAPYTVTWGNIPLGSHSLTAKAIDSAGVVGTSPPVALAAVPGPVVNVTAPLAQAKFYTPEAIAITANATPSGAAIASVAFYAGGNLIGTSTAAPYGALWNGAPAGSHAITAVATDADGVVSTSPVVNVTVAAPSVVIDSPLPGAAVSSEGVLVRGRILAPRYSGVVVNGQLAAIDSDGTFYAADVRPAPGTNSIDVLLSTPDEVQVTASVVVAPFTPVAPTTELTIAEVESVGPLDAKWTAKTARGIRDVVIDYWGDGTSVFRMSETAGYVAGSTNQTITIPYPAVGVIRPIITVEDMDGAILQKQFVLHAHNATALDIRLRAVWGRMLDGLRATDIPRALKSVTPAARERFEAVFGRLQPDAPTAASQLGTLEGAEFNVDSAEYIVVRPTEAGADGFPIYFIRCSDGVWRVNAM